MHQQGLLMRQIDELARVDGDDVAEEQAKQMREFIDLLERYLFITPVGRAKYLGGVREAMERRAKKK
jgi:hypothetical protein